jgi:rubredoxin
MNQLQTPDNEVGNQMKTNIQEVNEHINNLNNEVARLREKVERQAERIRYLEGATNHACGTPLSRANNEVARLRKYVEKLEIFAPENDWSLPEWRNLVGSKEQNEDPETLFKLYQFRLAPAPEEPVTEKASKFSVNPSFYEKCNVCGESYGDHTGHPDDPHCPLQPVDDWKCPHCGSTTGTWFSRVEPMGDICEDCGKAVDEEPIVVNPEPSNPFVAQKVDNLSDNEWRRLGPDEVICEGDEVQPNHFDKINGEWASVFAFEIGTPTSHHKWARYRTRRPLPKQEEIPLEDELKQLHELSECWSDFPSLANKVADNAASCLRYLRDEIQKLKEAK